MARVLVALISFALAGCAVVSVTSYDGKVTVSRHWGVLGIHIDSPAAASAVDLSYLGYASTPIGGYAGLGTARIFAAPPGCHLVVWTSGDLSPEWRSIISESASSCIVHSTKKGEHQ